MLDLDRQGKILERALRLARRLTAKGNPATAQHLAQRGQLRLQPFPHGVDAASDGVEHPAAGEIDV
ncbi:hypothetical protein [Azospirillum sp. B510]|uniref:hypothetical protein n=1 Tax=Azospirillum sp. (strain B510) TaxID=137722 RepID=UPI0015633E1F|nr:hypothetical protein [Azospirillum sp. B510]